jgi:hypothetical protein
MIAADVEGQKAIKTLIVITSSVPRYLMFENSIEALMAPRGSGLNRIGGANLVYNLNLTLEQAANYPWERVWYIDDDHQFDNDTLLRLLQHDVDVVASTTLVKHPNFMPVFYKAKRKNAKGQWVHTRYTWQELKGREGLLPVVAVGRSGMLIKRSVFERLVGLPKNGDIAAQIMWEETWRQGALNPYGQIGEDLDFCNRLQELAIPIHVDLDTCIGHIDPVAAWPYRKPDGTWTIALQWGSGNPITLGVAPEPNV